MTSRIALPLLALCLAPVLSAQLGVFEGQSDIGVTPKPGSAGFDSAIGEYRVTGSGDNMWTTTDAFHFVWKKMTGDFAITADVRFVGVGAVAHRKAALIVRQSLDPGSAYADAAVHGDGLTSLQFRPSADVLTQEVRSDLKAPMRLRLERRGNQFMLYAGTPGAELKPAGPATVALTDPVYAGLAVCSHDANVLETAIFSNVRIETLVK